MKFWFKDYRRFEFNLIVYVSLLGCVFLFFGSGKVSGWRLSGCCIIGTVAPSASSTSCFWGRIYLTCSMQYSHLIITSVASRLTRLNRVASPPPPISINKSMTPQMSTCPLLASRTGLASCIYCMRGQATFVSMLFRMNLAPTPMSHTDANRAVDRWSNPILA